MTHRKLDQGDAQWSVQALARWTLTVAVALGVVIVVGGAARWSSPAYAAALSFPAAPQSWGLVLAGAGSAGVAASLLGRLRLVAGCLLLVAIWSLFFGLSFLHVALHNRHTGTTGIPVYAFTAVTAGLLAVTHWRSARNS